jgi:CubicO group peptidase (beta-lactamase class C family)
LTVHYTGFGWHPSSQYTADLRRPHSGPAIPLFGGRHHYRTVGNHRLIGLPFPELMRELALDPLGMEDSSYEQPPPSCLADRAATAHPLNGNPTPDRWHVYPEMAAAGLWTTSGDLARLGAALMRGLRGETTDLGLSRQSLAAMLRPQLRTEAQAQRRGDVSESTGTWRDGGSGSKEEKGGRRQRRVRSCERPQRPHVLLRPRPLRSLLSHFCPRAR